jgi:drug/metabolite transporter (DMT)-like permease
MFKQVTTTTRLANHRMQISLLVCLAMLAFAGNSLLCRMALKQTAIDPASFTSVRLLSGACTLWLLVRLRRDTVPVSDSRGGNWLSALALFAYAAGFSFAYVGMTAATGALLLFGAVQATMIGYGLASGERLRGLQVVGFALALGGLVVLMLPGLATPSLVNSLSMLGAGVAWGVYSLRGKRVQGHGVSDPTRVTAGNFARAAPMALMLNLLMHGQASTDTMGIALAVGSGALASGVGYTIWYRVMPVLQATQAASVQLSVPVIASLGGVVLLGEPFTLTLMLTSTAILGGIALVTWRRK